MLDFILQWNMDMWGVQGVEAEAELLAAITTFFKRVGISSADVGIKVNSRAVLSEVNAIPIVCSTCEFHKTMFLTSESMSV